MSAGEDGPVVGERYVLGAKLGAGGMGVVHAATDRVLGRKVAIKLLSARQETEPTAFARLEREARAAAKLGHANIVRVLDFGRHGQGGFLVMEHLDGETLDARIGREGVLPVDAAVRIHLQLLDALATAHDEGVLHRDVKPSNVFLTPLAGGTELVKLLDFGLAYLMEEVASKKLTKTGIAIGTPAYMAPERLRGASVDARADVYSVGVSLYECLSGELPITADTPVALHARVLMEEPPSLAGRRGDLPDGLAEVVARALAKSPDDRWPSASAMAEALREASRAPRVRATAPVGENDPAALLETLPAIDVTPPRIEESTRPVDSPAIARVVPPAARRAPRRPAWLLGALVGAVAGVLVLGGIGLLHVTRRSEARQEDTSASSPPGRLAPTLDESRAERAIAPPTIEPAVETQAAVDPAAAAPTPLVEAPTVEAPTVEAPAPRRRVRSRPRTVSTETTAEPEPSLDRPLAPRWNTP